MSKTLAIILSGSFVEQCRGDAPDLLHDLKSRVECIFANQGNHSLSSDSSWRWGWDSNIDPSFHDWIKYPVVDLWVKPINACFSFGSGTSLISIPVRWEHFRKDTLMMSNVFQMASAFLKIVKGVSAIYIPDSSCLAAENAIDEFYNCRPFREIEIGLLRNLESHSMSELLGGTDEPIELCHRVFHDD